MTRLFVLRHAKATSALPGMRDFDRPLEAVGHVAAAALGDKMRQLGHLPERVLCSPSLRTRQTLEGVARCFAMPVEAEFQQDMFSGEWSHYLEFINNTQGDGALLLVGHNPACEDLVHQLVGTGEKTALRNLLGGYAPGTLAVIDFEGPFSSITAGKGHLQNLLLDGCAKR